LTIIYAEGAEMTFLTEDAQVNSKTTTGGLMNPDPLLNEKQAAEYVNLGVRTLQAFRCRGGGPTFYKLGAKKVAYRLSDLEAWITAGRRSSTSDAGPSHTYEN
jgi:predicted DNA-binding transcriptional regulator AlpA